VSRKVLMKKKGELDRRMCLGHVSSTPGSTIIGLLKSERGPGQAHLSTVPTGVSSMHGGGKPLKMFECFIDMIWPYLSYRVGV